MPGKQKEIEFLGIPEMRKQFETLTSSYSAEYYARR